MPHIKTIKSSTALALIFMLAGCISPEQEAAIKRKQEAAYQQELTNKCQNLGFTPGAPDFLQCKLSLYKQDQATKAAMEAAAIQGTAMAQPQPASGPFQPLENLVGQPYTPRSPVTTNCMKNGAFVNCTSY